MSKHSFERKDPVVNKSNQVSEKPEKSVENCHDLILSQLQGLAVAGKKKIPQKSDLFSYAKRRVPWTYQQENMEEYEEGRHRAPNAPYRKSRFGMLLAPIFNTSEEIKEANFYKFYRLFLKSTLGNLLRKYSINYLSRNTLLKSAAGSSKVAVKLITVKRTRQLRAVTFLKYFLYRLKKYHTPKQIGHQILNRLTVKSRYYDVAKKLQELKVKRFSRLVRAATRKLEPADTCIYPKSPIEIFYAADPESTALLEDDPIFEQKIEEIRQQDAEEERARHKRVMTSLKEATGDSSNRIKIPTVTDPLAGLSFKCSGRFSRQQMASSVLLRRGSVSASSLWLKVDYAKGMVPLKYGAVGVKVYATHTYGQ